MPSAIQSGWRLKAHWQNSGGAMAASLQSGRRRTLPLLACFRQVPQLRCASNFAGGSAIQRVDRLPVPEDIKQSLMGMGVSRLFEIQAKVFDPILKGTTVVGRSRTGTGKTLAYLLPLLERMRQQKMNAPHSLLILVPTRELCKQVGAMILSLAATTDLALVYSDVSNRVQDQQVKLGPRVVIATPGRCLGLVNKKLLEVKNVQALVVDEADAMLSLEFIARVEKVLLAVSKPTLQTVLMAASMPPEMLNVLSRHFPSYQLVDMVDKGGPRNTSTVENMRHSLCRVTQASGERERVLLHILDKRMDELEGQAIVFVDSGKEAKMLATHPILQRKARALHGESSLKERDAFLTAFASGEFEVLITTDIVARGVDFKDVSLVMQLRPPRDTAQYVHRAGRTGRAGRSGLCVTLYDPTEYSYVQRVREATRQKFSREDAPGAEDIHHAATSRLLDELLSVPPEQYEPIMKHAKALLQERGPSVLALALAMLDGRRVGVDGVLGQSKASLLSGRSGFVCFHAYDPDHTTTTQEHDFRRVVFSLLPRTADESHVGKIVATVQGWAVDIAEKYAKHLEDDLKSGRKTAPFEFIVPKELPRLKRVSARKARRLPWRSMQKSARKSRAHGGGSGRLARQ